MNPSLAITKSFYSQFHLSIQVDFSSSNNTYSGNVPNRISGLKNPRFGNTYAKVEAIYRKSAMTP